MPACITMTPIYVLGPARELVMVSLTGIISIVCRMLAWATEKREKARRETKAGGIAKYSSALS